MVFIGIGAYIGLVGWPLAMIGLFSTIILSLPDIGLIHPLFGSILVFFGLVFFVIVEGNKNN